MQVAASGSLRDLFPLANTTPTSDNETWTFLITVYRYSRADLLRILRLTARQLAAWEKAELVAAAESYSFFDLLQIKKIRDLCAHKVRPAVIRRSLDAMQKQAAGMENPLVEASVLSAGHRIAFRHQGRLVEPIAGQFMFDFSARDNVVTSTATPLVKPGPIPADVTGLFAQGIALEEDPNTQTQAIAAYQRVLELDPEHAAAHINLGTLHYNRQDYTLSEKHYRAAIEIDPRYALAYFDLGNVLDETGRVAAAIQAYNTALLPIHSRAARHGAAYGLCLPGEVGRGASDRGRRSFRTSARPGLSISEKSISIVGRRNGGDNGFQQPDRKWIVAGLAPGARALDDLRHAVCRHVDQLHGSPGDRDPQADARAQHRHDRSELRLHCGRIPDRVRDWPASRRSLDRQVGHAHRLHVGDARAQ